MEEKTKTMNRRKASVSSSIESEEGNMNEKKKE